MKQSAIRDGELGCVNTYVLFLFKKGWSVIYSLYLKIQFLLFMLRKLNFLGDSRPATWKG